VYSIIVTAGAVPRRLSSWASVKYRLTRSLHQHREKQLAILEHDRSQLYKQSKDEMEIGHRQNALASRLWPSYAQASVAASSPHPCSRRTSELDLGLRATRSFDLTARVAFDAGIGLSVIYFDQRFQSERRASTRHSRQATQSS
jgi:hypothetical protein